MEKKIDTLKQPRPKIKSKSNKDIHSKRSVNKIKESITTSYEGKNNINLFKKKQEGSLQKVLKKTQSDKYLVKQVPTTKNDNVMNITQAEQEKEDKLIHKFVTQVTRS